MANTKSPRRWLPIAEAVRIVAERREPSYTEASPFIRKAEAAAALKADIEDGELPAQGKDRAGELVAIERHWLAYLSEMNDCESINSGYLWFDRHKAAQTRLAKAASRGDAPRPSLPPDYVGDVKVDAARLAELYPPPDAAARGEPLLDRERQPADAAAALGNSQQSKPRQPTIGASVARGRRGCKAGSGEIDDEPKLQEMLGLLAAEKATSVYNAARKVAALHFAEQNRPAATDRLRRKFRLRWGTEPPEGKTWADVLHQVVGLDAARQQTAVADPVEAVGQHVDQGRSTRTS
jgi:hypothetical protein